MAATDKQPIYIILCGKDERHVNAIREKIKPEFEISITCNSMPQALSTISLALGAENPSSITQKPKAVYMGGGFSEDDCETARTSHPAAKSVPWIRPVHTQPGFQGEIPKGPPSSEVLADRARKVLDAHAQEMKEGKGAGEIWYF